MATADGAPAETAEAASHEPMEGWSVEPDESAAGRAMPRPSRPDSS